jgi:microcin C transport system substrate-binding protein
MTPSPPVPSRAPAAPAPRGPAAAPSKVRMARLFFRPRCGWLRLARAAALAVALAPAGARTAAGADTPPPAAAPEACVTLPVYRGQGVALYDLPKYPEGFAHFDYVRPDAPKGGTIRLAQEGGFDSLHPFIPKGDSVLLGGYVYETLMVASLDEPFTMYGLLAESVELPEDRSWITFHLRPEARWSDGMPVTAEDVVFSYTTLVTHGWPYYRLYYRAVEAVEALGPHTVRFRLNIDQVNRELPLICGQLPVLPQHYWAGRDFTVPTLEPPVGSGPYRITAVEPNRSVTFERNREYWGQAVNVQVGQYNFDRMRIDFFRDSVVKREAFKSGAFDWMLVASAKEWATEYDIPEVRAGVIRREVLENERVVGMQGVAYNLRRPLFQDRRVRQALAYAFDFEWANRVLMHDSYVRSRSYFGNSDLEARGVPGGRELEILNALRDQFPGQVPPEVFTGEYQPPSTGVMDSERAHRLAVRRNLLEARRLLAEAGWTVRPEDRRLVHPDHRDAQGRLQPFTFELLLVSPAFERIVLPFRLALRRLGIECRVRTVDSSVYMNRLLNFEFDMTVHVWRMSDSPGNEQKDFWDSSVADVTGSLNLIGLRNPAIDAAVKRLIAAPTRAELEACTRALDRLLQWGHYCVPNWHFAGDRMVYWDKFGHPEVTPEKGTLLTLWWVDAERERTLPARRAALRRRGAAEGE